MYTCQASVPTICVTIARQTQRTSACMPRDRVLLSLARNRRQAFADEFLRQLRIRGHRSFLTVKFRQDLRLHAAAPQGFGVGDFRVEHHHGIARDETLRETPLETHGDGLTAQVARVQHRGTHLGVIFHGHLRYGGGVGPPQRLELLEYRVPTAVSLEQGIERQAILERRVHALAVKGHDRVRRVPEEQQLTSKVPGRGVYAAELPLRMKSEFS